MAERLETNDPWLVAVWPGMGHVAINAGIYLMSKLGMHLEAEFDARELFEMDHVDVDHGLIRTGRLPRSRFFLCKDPAGKRDLIVFLGEAQPPSGIHAYCRRIIGHAQELGVKRVFTFAAMATPMRVEDESRIFAAATSRTSLEECMDMRFEIVDEGRISGLNGVLPGVAAERGLEGACLLGEMPHLFAQLPYPRASLAVLRAFCQMAGIKLDLSDLEREAEAVESQLKQLVSKIEDVLRQQQREQEGAVPVPEEPEEEEKKPGLEPQDRQRIEELFAKAKEDRSQAFKLKQELDRLKVFSEYEDPFLDLFKGSNAGKKTPPHGEK